MALTTVCHRPGLRPGLHRKSCTRYEGRFLSIVGHGVHGSSTTGLTGNGPGILLASCTKRLPSYRKRVAKTCYRHSNTEQQPPPSLLDAIPAADMAVFQRAESAWRRLCTSGPAKPRTVVTRHQGKAPQGSAAAQGLAATTQYDVVVLGGTLGIIVATALLHKAQQQQQQRGGDSAAANQALRVAVVERGLLVGRQQEWNISKQELQVLVDCGVLTSSQLSAVVASEWSGGVRMGVAGQLELNLSGVMDCGVAPEVLIQIVKRRFLDLGGVILEHTSFDHLHVYDDAAILHLTQQQQQQQQQHSGAAGGRAAAFESSSAAPAPAPAAEYTNRLAVSAAVVVDALGTFSPISAQARGEQVPESAMLLVGSCVDLQQQQQGSSSSSSSSDSADVLWGMTPIDKLTKQQFWFERFPAAGGAAVTSYMFAFTDAAAANSDVLSHMLDVYLQQLPEYLGVSSSQLLMRRGVFGFVPCYPNRVTPITDRLLPVGDSAANRSALSLAGFCALVRHLPRLTAGLLEALAAAATDKQDLALLQPWCPGVTATSAMQRTMAVHSNQHTTIHNNMLNSSSSSDSGYEVLDIMAASLSAMCAAGGGGGDEQALKAFVADRLQWTPLAGGIKRQVMTDMKQLIAYSQFLGDTRGAARLAVGLAGLGWYTLLHNASKITGPFHEALLSQNPLLLYRWHRYVDAWKYGSGSDWTDTAASSSSSSSSSSVTTAQPPLPSVYHSIDTYEDSLAVYEGADLADGGLCPVDQPLCVDPMHSMDATDVIDWADSPNEGWGSRRGIAAAAAAGSSSNVSRMLRTKGWGLGQKHRIAWLIPCGGQCRAGQSAVAAAAGRSSSSSSSDDRRKLERLLLSLVDTTGVENCRPGVDPQDIQVSIDGPPRPITTSSSSSSSSSSGEGEGDTTHYDGSEAVRLLYPQLDPSSTWDEYEIIDWSDVPNNGWGSSSSSSGSGASSGGGKVQCFGSPRAHGSAGSSSGSVLCWGSSKCRSVWVANSGISSSSRCVRCLLAAAAAGGGGGGGAAAADGTQSPSTDSIYHSVDTYEDSLQGYEGSDATDQGLCAPDTPACTDPAAAAVAAMASVDAVDIINWSDSDSASQQAQTWNSGSSSSSSGDVLTAATPAAAAAAKQGGARTDKKTARPYMNIVNGRWVPPSRSDAERMMAGHNHMGPDEGL